jgi:hypothetical protein
MTKYTFQQILYKDAYDKPVNPYIVLFLELRLNGYMNTGTRRFRAIMCIGVTCVSAAWFESMLFTNVATTVFLTNCYINSLEYKLFLINRVTFDGLRLA